MSYDIGAIGVTATTTVSLVASFLTTTTAGKPSCNIAAVWADVGGNAMTTAGGGYLIGSSWQTVGTQTTTTAPNKKNNNNPAASVAAVALAANGAIGTGTQTSRISVGYAQVGPGGFWMAASPDLALAVPNGGTVTGYVDFSSRTASASMLLNWNVDFWEA